MHDWHQYFDKGGKGHSRKASCYTSHPPMPLPGMDAVIYGGSCLHPVVKDADVYIGFDSGIKSSRKAYPWEAGHSFLFHIPDMGVPAEPEDFKKLVEWTIAQLKAGKKVHCGCIGGHGRTGMFLAALVATLGEPDAITYVRKNYCKKAVESQSQTKFLATHFGVKAVAGSKAHYAGSGSKGSGFMSATSYPESTWPSRVPKAYAPMQGAPSAIW